MSVGKAALQMLALNLAEELKDTGIRVATVTIVGSIGRSDRFAAERIAGVYWNLHSGEGQTEVVYR